MIIGVLYLGSGWFGIVASIIFLPDVRSVGSSASLFGLIGAQWSNVILNRRSFLARKMSVRGLLFETLLNVAFGFCPWIDNFMHLGGAFAGLVAGLVPCSFDLRDVAATLCR